MKFCSCHLLCYCITVGPECQFSVQQSSSNKQISKNYCQQELHNNRSLNPIYPTLVEGFYVCATTPAYLLKNPPSSTSCLLFLVQPCYPFGNFLFALIKQAPQSLAPHPFFSSYFFLFYTFDLNYSLSNENAFALTCFKNLSH